MEEKSIEFKEYEAANIELKRTMNKLHSSCIEFHSNIVSLNIFNLRKIFYYARRYLHYFFRMNKLKDNHEICFTNLKQAIISRDTKEADLEVYLAIQLLTRKKFEYQNVA